MFRSLALFTAAFTLSACSTIDRGFYDNVRVDTVPQGATASFTYIPSDPIRTQPGAVKRMTCEETPCAFEIARTQRGIVRIEKDGFAPVEYFVSPSRYRLGGGVDMKKVAQKTIPTSLATGLTGGLAYAAFTQSSLGILWGGLLTPGLGTYQPVSTSTGAIIGTGVGVGIAAGSMLIDMGTSANENVYPNPVVIGLADTGTEVEGDPFVDAYYDLIAIYREKEIACTSRNRRNAAGLTCHDARLQLNAANKTLTALETQRDAEIKALIKAQKEAQE